MPAPTNNKQVQSLIGMISYLSKFSARLSEILESISELAKNKVPFNWSPEQQSAFTQMKQEILSASILAYYNPKKQTVLQTDASIKRFRHMSAARRKISLLCQQSFNRCIAIELESFAVVWAMEKVSSFPVCKPFHLGN